MLSIVLLTAGCKTPQSTTQTPVADPVIVETTFEQLDTMVISADAVPKNPEDYELPVYRASQSKPNDLKHTKLRLSFDWENEQVIGQATLKFEPTFYPQNSVTVDAKGFDFKSIKLNNSAGQDLKYEYTGQEVTIMLPRTYQRGQEYEVYIDYIATPAASGGSSAITSDKGLFFINPRGEEADKPRQIWTQGETEHNSRWMPTIDQPNERSTQEFWITVNDKYKTLSNGLMISSTPAPNGRRTDYWRMDQPHAPYLHMLVVGEFAKVDDKWRNIPLSYYVEEEYRPYAKEIFAHTPEMMEFFSTKLGVDYPWAKYAQIIVRDYVSGAMENTTASIFGEFVQKTDVELAEDHNDLIVAHEMFHHWFGDYVTTESWSNLTLNEGFANYSEYLWFEHHDGIDGAESHRLNELNGYIGSGNFHPLIWYGFAQNEDMFDAHSYNKGGLVLHMLRKQIGDDAFFASLKKYLNDNKYTAVEVGELRMAFEDTLGEDLQWFFDQWFLGNGHPELTIDYAYADGNAMVTVEQTQDPDNFRPIFILPTRVEVFPANGGKSTVHEVMMDKRIQTFTVPAGADDLVVFDPETTILAVRDEKRSIADSEKIFNRVPYLQKQLFAVRALNTAADSEDYTVPATVVKKALNAKSLRIRNNGIGMADPSDPAMLAVLEKLALGDKESNVRQNVISRLSSIPPSPQLVSLFSNVLENDKSPSVQAAALQGLFQADPTTALAKAKMLENTESDALIAGIGGMYAASGDAEYLPYFEDRLTKVDNQEAGEFVGAYLGLAFQNGPEALTKAVKNIGSVAANQKSSLWQRYGYTMALAELRGLTKSDEAAAQPGMDAIGTLLTEQINTIKSAETNSQLKMVFGQI
jgi:aminopeptidase N